MDAETHSEPPVVTLTAVYLTEDGFAVYPVEVLMVQKSLMRSGATVEFDYPPDRRVYRRLKSAVAEQAVNFAVSFSASALIWLLQWMATKGKDRPVKITTTRTHRRGRKEHSSETLTYEGPASGAVEVIERWKREADEDS